MAFNVPNWWDVGCLAHKEAIIPAEFGVGFVLLGRCFRKCTIVPYGFKLGEARGDNYFSVLRRCGPLKTFSSAQADLQ